MTKVDFYTGSEDKLRTACQLSQKAMQNGLRVLLHVPDNATAEALDKLLWHYPATAFLPHCHSNESDAATMPVVIGRGESFPHSELLISLHNECLPFFSRFERVIEIVNQDDEDAKLGRERYVFYKDRGYELRHFDLRKNMKQHINHDLLPILTETVDGTLIDLPTLTEAVGAHLSNIKPAFPLTSEQCQQLSELLFPRLEVALRNAIGSRSEARWEKSMLQVRAILSDLIRDTVQKPHQ